MNLSMLVFVLVLIIEFCQDAMGEKPMMLPKGGEMNVTKGTELKIECWSKSSAKLWFSYPENTFLTPRSDHKILSNGNGKHTFLRSNATIEDTGWYACAKEGIEIDNHFKNLNHIHNDISWIYVYVIGGYSGFLEAVPPFPKTIIVVPGISTVVPCRPVKPSAYVELTQNFKVAEKYDTVQFDPRIGFVIDKVDFEAGEAIFTCTTTLYEVVHYVLRYSAATGPKPTMVTADNELIVQEGNELRIECYGGSKISFLFPEPKPKSYGSEYKIFRNENGTSTFLRHKAISNDTGWYGCGGEGIENNIPDWSVNYTSKEISWIYVYVNSSVPMVSGSWVYGDWRPDGALISCRPTSPGRHIDVRWLNHTIEEVNDIVEFDSKLGFLFRALPTGRDIMFYCTSGETANNVSPNYAISKSLETLTPVITDVENSLNSGNLIIRMTGEDLNIRCEAFASENLLFRLEWKVGPSTVSKDRVQYNRTLIHYQTPDTHVYSTRRRFMVTINNVRESHSGIYHCSSSTWNNVTYCQDSRRVEIFDQNGGRYIKLDNQGGALHMTEPTGGTAKWLVDLGDFPSAKIYWRDPQGRLINGSIESDGSRHVTMETSNGGALQKLFLVRDLKPEDSGVFEVQADIGNMTSAVVKITLDVLTQPKPVMERTPKKDFYSPKQEFNAFCWSRKSQLLNLTWSYWGCPKLPSHKDCTLVYNRTTSSPEHAVQMGRAKFGKSGLLNCETCNILSCSTATEEIFILDSPSPLFTSTNMNQSEITLNLETDKNKVLVLECYVSGWPIPIVTWFKNNVSLKEDNQFKFAYDNRELSIQYFLVGEGGRYTCTAENKHGKIENYIDLTIEGGPNIMQWSLIGAAAVLLVVIVVSWLIIYKLRSEASKKKSIDAEFKNGALNRFNPDLSVVDQAELLPYDNKWEFPRELLTLGKVLGSGAFGIVKKAEARSICRGETVTIVAVKLVRATASLNFMTALSRELKILVYLGKHPNVVNLLGACTKNVSYGELLVIVEYCRFGNLRDYLLRHRADFPTKIHSTSKGMVGSSLDTDCATTGDSGVALITSSNATDCDAMSSKGDYRQDEQTNTLDVLHGDLAARNILLADNNIVKICDFGLSKTLHDEAQYRGRGEDPLPVKWMAIEAIKDRIFSVQSDIWSFGIVMWEFFTLAKTPYPDIRPRELYQKLAEGHRMGKPEYASSTIYDMMLLCWDADPAKRPSFANLAHNIGDLLDDGFKTYYHKLSSSYMEMDEDIPEDGRKDYLTLSPSELNPTSDTSSTVHNEIELTCSLPSQ